MRTLLPCLLAAAAAAAEPFNGNLELGEVGQAAPGFHLRQFFLPTVPVTAHLPLTADDGAGGRCLRMPGVRGRVEYDVGPMRFTLERDGEAELSFRLRADAAEDGSFDPAQQVVVDLRAFDPRALQWKPVAERYPVLTAFALRPERVWRSHIRRIAVRGGFPYALAFRCSTLPPGTLNALEIDDLAVRPLDVPATTADEAAVLGLREPAVYHPDERVELRVRARLAEAGGPLAAALVDDHDGAVVARQELALEPLEAAPGRDGRRTWGARWALPAPRFGSFSTVLARDGVLLRCCGGDLVVARPPVRHPAGSPGASLGANLESYVPLPLTPTTEPTMHTVTGRPGDEVELLRLAGVQAVRVWADWNLVEPEPGRFRADVLGRQLDALAAAGMEPLLVLGTTFTHAPAPTARPLKGTLPAWLYRDATLRPGTVVPPMAAWDGYVAACLRLFGPRVRWWEVVNEASNGWSAEEYLPRLESAHRLIKQARPDAVVVGNGATGDVGPRPLDWTRALAALHHERFLDAIAFHPYQAELDLRGQDRFKYRDLVAGLRGLLREPRPLWNTECYYLLPAGRTQGVSADEQSTYEAGDLQRHYLDGLWHGVAVSTAPLWDSLTKRRRGAALVPNQVFAGLNALSCLLEGMAGLERIEVNPLVRSGVFASADGRRGLGVVYDLRPGGSHWQAPATGFAGVEILDLFGNPLAASGELRCSADPLFLRGDPATIAALLRASRWRVAEPLALAATVVGGRLHLEAANRTGLAAAATVEFPGSGLPAVDCRFHAAERLAVALPAAVLPAAVLPARLPWTARADGEPAGGGSLELGAARPVLALTLDQPLRATLARGSALTLTAHADHLAIAASVPEAVPRPAPDGRLYEGSALEVFVDAAPGFRPDCDQVAGGAEKMAVTQYIATAVPSPGGQTLWSHAHRRPQAASTARASRTRNDGGWQVLLEVPWDELVAPGGAPAVIGLNAEIDRLAGKESWGALPGESYRRRLHYPLLALPAEVVARGREPARALALYGAAPLADGGFDSDGAWRIQGAHPALRIADGAGWGGSRGVDITMAPAESASLPARLAVYQRLPCRPRSGRIAQVSFLLRLTDLRCALERTPDGYRCGFSAYLHFRDGAAGVELNNEGLGLGSAVLGSQEWTLMGFRCPIPDQASELTLSLGTRGPVSGRVQIDAVDIAFLEP
ncbi:MAG: beta-galactosidase [Planctomycetes bacterium]|nr:beta-galactosidase [Planctomycetota bacterium]